MQLQGEEQYTKLTAIISATVMLPLCFKILRISGLNLYILSREVSYILRMQQYRLNPSNKFAGIYPESWLYWIVFLRLITFIVSIIFSPTRDALSKLLGKRKDKEDIPQSQDFLWWLNFLRASNPFLY